MDTLNILRCRRNSAGSDHLDMLRGLAAVMVMLNHARAIFFVEYHHLVGVRPTTTAFYAATALGHQAVMIFFVMSGFFVGGGVLAVGRSRWDWSSYVANRFTRLYIVLIPGLALTALWDAIGSGCAPGVYGGHDNAAIEYSVPDRLNPAVLAGNLVYLQTLVVPTFGSNGPLWSLSNEFWYYIVFPLFALPLVSACDVRRRILYMVSGGALLLTLLRPLAPYFFVWGLGVVVAILPGVRLSRFWAFALAATGIAGLLLSVLAARRTGPWVGSHIVGLAAMGLIYCFVVASDVLPSPAWYGRTARWLAGFSFTLYIAHLPVLAACRAVLSPGRKFSPSATDGLAFATIVVGVMGYSWALSTLTEVHTDRVRKWLTRRFSSGRGDAGIPMSD